MCHLHDIRRVHNNVMTNPYLHMAMDVGGHYNGNKSLHIQRD